jgi:hypothetical protein
MGYTEEQAASETTVHLQGPVFENSFRRAQAYASKSGAAINLTVTRERSGWIVAWNWNRGTSWARGGRRTRLSQNAAGAFAAEKWAALAAWLEKVEPVRTGLPGDWTCGSAA